MRSKSRLLLAGLQFSFVSKNSFQCLSFLFRISVARTCWTERIAAQAPNLARFVSAKLVLGRPAQEGLIITQLFRLFVFTSFLGLRPLALLLLSSFSLDGFLACFLNAFRHESSFSFNGDLYWMV